MPQKTEWPEPRLAENGRDEGRQPDTETLLAELGAFYPVVRYPSAEEQSKPEDQLDHVIFAGLVWP